MIDIGILSNQNGLNKGMQDFYPLFKWKKILKETGFKHTFYNNHNLKGLFGHDVVIISHRYVQEKTVIKNEYPDNDFIKEIICKLRNFGIKVIFFDFSADTGCRYFDLINYVDLMVKRQLLRDKFKYVDESRESMKIYAWDYGLNNDEEIELKSFFSQFSTCPKDQLYKLMLGWNIGMVDYRFFPIKKYYPISTERILNFIYRRPQFISPDVTKRKIDSAFRGQIKKGNKSFSYQRNKLISFLNSKKNDRAFVTGGRVSKRQFIRELRTSKTCVSPYGWGEVCYRDFEAILNGCVLIKPDMSHMDTWPDIYKEQKTYVPLRWDMRDLEKVLYDVLDNYEDYLGLVYKGQNYYRETIDNPKLFVRQFKKIVIGE